MRLRRIQPPVRRRAGMTLIEFVLVMFVAVVAICLIVPAIVSTRGVSRRSDCLNNVHNISLAIQNSASARKGGLPYLDEGGYNWPVALLSYLDHSDLAEDPAYFNAVSIACFTCPDDANNFGKPNGLSYGVNGGYGNFPRAGRAAGAASRSGGSGAVDFQVLEIAATSGNFGCHAAYDFGWVSGANYPNICPPPSGTPSTTPKDADCARDTGVFWHDLRAYGNCPYLNDQFRMNLDRIHLKDGLSQTFLLLENHNARNWGGGVTANVAYGPLGSSPIRSAVLDSAVVIHRPDLQLGSPAGRLAITGHDPHPISRINSHRYSVPGRSPFASSSHPGLVVVGFCDGRVRAISENISFSVYASLFTSGGTERGEAEIAANSY